MTPCFASFSQTSCYVSQNAVKVEEVETGPYRQTRDCHPFGMCTVRGTILVVHMALVEVL